MGSDKALLVVDGRPLAVAVADALWEAGLRPVWCQGGDATALAAMGLTVVADESPGNGPLAGIITALRHAEGGDIVVAACDLPDLAPDAVRSLLDAEPAAGADPPVVVFASVGEAWHLLSWWSADALSTVESLYESGVRSYGAALGHLGALGVPVPAEAVRNVNRPTDLA